MVLDGVQLVGGGVAALARQLLLGVVGPRAARDVDVAAAQVAAAFEGRRRRGDAVYDNTGREKFCVLRTKDGEHVFIYSTRLSRSCPVRFLKQKGFTATKVLCIF